MLTQQMADIGWTEDKVQMVYALLIREGHMSSYYLPLTEKCHEVLRGMRDGATIKYTESYYDGSKFEVEYDRIMFEAAVRENWMF